MARFFSEQEIDGFRDCFYLNCKSGVINDVDQLKFVMRSVGFSPTIDELKRYLEQRRAVANKSSNSPNDFIIALDNSIKFADFLDCAHAHMQVERVPEEILKAFKVSPFVKDSNISVDTLRHLLCGWGEKLAHREFNALLKEMNINKPEMSYTTFVNSLVIPRLDNN